MFLLSLLMYPSFTWAIHIALSSYKMVDAFPVKVNYTYSRYVELLALAKHSRLVSCIVIIFAWFEETTINVYFVESNDIVIPSHINKYLIWDRH